MYFGVTDISVIRNIIFEALKHTFHKQRRNGDRRLLSARPCLFDLLAQKSPKNMIQTGYLQMKNSINQRSKSLYMELSPAEKPDHNHCEQRDLL